MRRPQDFAIDLTAEEVAAGGWTVLGKPVVENPHDTLPDPLWAVVRIWRSCRGDAGLAVLPEAGGLLDQAAWLLDAIDACSAAEAGLRAEEQERREREREGAGR